MSGAAWPVVPLGDVVESMKNGIYRQASSYADDGVACLRMYNIGEGRIVWRDIKRMRLSEREIVDYELLPGDLLVNRVNSRELVGKAAVIPVGLERCVFESKNIRVRLRRDLAVPQFVSYRLLAAGVGYFTRNAQQVVGMASISQPQVARFPLPLPPLAEQCEIVAEIEKQFTRLDAGVAALRRVQANLKRYRASILKAACEGRLVPTEAELAQREGRPYETGDELLQRILANRRSAWTGRGNFRGPQSPDAVKSPLLPAGWTSATLGQLLAEQLCNGISVKGSDNPPGIKALRLSAMTDSGFDYGDARYLPLSDADVDDLWIQAGDFFVSRGNGSLHLVGRGTQAQPPPSLTIFPDTMIRVRLARDLRATRWVATIWPVRFVRSQIEAKVKTTAGIYKIAQPQLEQIVLPIPPLAEQHRIVGEVERRSSILTQQEAAVSASLQRAARLRQAILHRAFGGDLINAHA